MHRRDVRDLWDQTAHHAGKRCVTRFGVGEIVLDENHLAAVPVRIGTFHESAGVSNHDAGVALFVDRIRGPFTVCSPC